MKKTLIFLNLILVFFAYSQTKLAPEIYMQNDPTHSAKKYKNIIFKTNADGLVNDAIIEMLKNHGFNPYSYFTLFPNIKTYKDEEINKVLKEKEIDLYLVFDVQSSNYTSPVTFKYYQIGNQTSFSANSGNTVNMFFSMFFFDPDKDEPFVRVDGKVYSEGNYSKRARPLTMKFINQSLKGLYDNSVIIKPSKK